MMKTDNQYLHSQIISRLALTGALFIPLLVRLHIINIPPGYSTVNQWSLFQDYSSMIMPSFPAEIGAKLTNAINVIEGFLVVGLILGYKIKLIAKGASLLTGFYTLNLLVLFGYPALYRFPVFMLSVASAILSMDKKHPWTIDSLLEKTALEKSSK
ncbi:hypothetical protein [Pedobacter sp.]|uniref:hypothetical protein n=1 Tax=Pedobacter sp. TaxID=1411316 RepID=UPI003C4A3747